MSQLPLLPGYSIEVEKKDRYHKNHFFDVHNGTRVDRALELEIHNNLPTSSHPANVVSSKLATNAAVGEYSNPIRKKIVNGNPPLSRLPAWVAYDRKVLRFYGYFKESVHSSPAETWRVRKCVFYYYLEDDSLHIAEPKIENSGIPQGVFVKRHRVPKESTGNSKDCYYHVEDMHLGATIPIYGRVFRLVACDEFTRKFYQDNHLALGTAEEYPEDSFSVTHKKVNVSHHKLTHPHKNYMEASLGKPSINPAATQQFLRLDGQVLRFYAQWDDDKMYGEKRPYIIHYYLADDTLEVCEIQQPNSGRDLFPTLLRRQKLAKNWTESVPNVAKLGCAPEDLSSQWYSLDDLRIGSYINVYGRQLLLCGVDAFTKDYYFRHFQCTDGDFIPLNMKDAEDEIKQLTPPPYNGYGTEEDSLGSFLFLMPKVPKADFEKIMTYDGISLRFFAKLIAPCTKVDRDRRFVFTYFVATDQFSVFEQKDRNSGFLGGKFLEKTRLKNQETNEWFAQEDFYVGAVVNVNNYTFEILDMDDYTRNWRAQNGKKEREEFKESEPRFA